MTNKIIRSLNIIFVGKKYIAITLPYYLRLYLLKVIIEVK